LLSVVVGGLLLMGAAFSDRATKDPVAINAYHASVKEAVAAFPVSIGVWSGHDVDLPPSAIKLLRPNAIVAREYRTESNGGVSATLMIVQCADIRDMQGHYPPNCYPAHGWDSGAITTGARIGGLPATRYEFSRMVGNRAAAMTVYNLFVMPTGHVTGSMDEVRKAGADYGLRPYGAAQLQILIGNGVDESLHAWVLDEMRAIAEPVLAVLLAGAPAHRRGVEP
jgi:hypothetical protein